MQPCKTGDQPYTDASPNGECSLRFLSFPFEGDLGNNILADDNFNNNNRS